MSWRLNVDKDDADASPDGRPFQVLAAATKKVQSPTVRHVIGTMSTDVDV